MTKRKTTDTFAARLVRLRAAAGLTQAQLAARSGLSLQAVCFWEQGRRAPTLASAGRLAAALGCALAELAGG